jgi:23S rRNA (cytidine1920-2'-O)/16S rRNA (cytidine1409-2'-O)-methyltransferase
VERRLASSRARAQSLILAGRVFVDERPADKVGALVGAEAPIRVKGGDLPYVSRGGLKLEAALDGFSVDPAGRVCLDVGASTGGFTDCLLQRGARRVFAVDVGYGQLAWSLRKDPRVTVIERTNIRHMPPEALDEPVGLAVVDVSFISLKIVVPAVLPHLVRDGELIVLIKPQFEVGRGAVGKGGVVRDPLQRARVVQELRARFEGLGLACGGPLPSPVEGPKGNRELLLHMTRRRVGDATRD